MKQRMQIAIIGSNNSGGIWYGSYGLVAAHQSGIAKHWGFGFQVEPAAMVAQGIIRVLEEYQVYDIEDEVVFITNYADVINNRSSLVFSQIRTRETTEKNLQATNQQEIWEKLLKITSALGRKYRLENSRDKEELDIVHIARKLATETAQLASRKIKNMSSANDDLDLSWLKAPHQ